MPRKPQKPCKFQGCPNLTDGAFCEQHKQTENQRYNRYQRDPDHAKRYGTQWRKIRARYIAAHPLCELCKSEGWLTPAEQVHHKVKVADGGSNDWENLQALCQSCHSRIHCEQGDRWG
jgi:5-methylcytosine-specific restriction protein A